VFLNLVKNAPTRRQGAITIATRMDAVSRPPARRRRHLVVSVADNGPGVPDPTRFLFAPFFDEGAREWPRAGALSAHRAARRHDRPRNPDAGGARFRITCS
jgi:K+-sensing histidine kinase KdpD